MGKACAFSIYDKNYELEQRHGITWNQSILRVELRLESKRIKKLIKGKHWWDQLRQLVEDQPKITQKFLHRLHQDAPAIYTYDETVQQIKSASQYRDKTRRRMLFLIQKTSDSESLSAAMGKTKKQFDLKKSTVSGLVDKLYAFDVSPIALPNRSEVKLLESLYNVLVEQN